jgi:hypothetical protein
MRYLFTTIFLLFTVYSVKATSVRKYTKSKDGFTLITTISGKEDSLIFDAFFERILSKLNRNDRNIPILLLIDYSGIKNNRMVNGFASIAIDTLREFDPFFIGAYYYHRLGKSFDEFYHTYEPYPSKKYLMDLSEPIDINSSFDSTSLTGLKIIYNYGAADSIIAFDRVYTLVQYGINNVDKIKNEQKRIAMDYEFGAAKISFLTIDTGEINRLPLLSLGFNPRAIDKRPFKNSKHWFIGVAVMSIIVLSLFYLKRQRLTRALKMSGRSANF